MSIFSKTISALDYADIALLQSEGSTENIRLEFKREIPTKVELLKKLSSLANTYGGYLVVGVEQDPQAKASALPGVAPQAGFNQQVTQWCYDGVYPPVAPFVSPPVENPGQPGTVFYVVYVAESSEAPHFINGRRGCYVRTDEFSQRFEAKLATYEEIQHLSNRRQRALDLRESLVLRARSRFENHVALNYHTRRDVLGDIDLTMWMAVVPTFPQLKQFQVSALERAVRETKLGARQERFPMGAPSTQHESFFFPDPRAIEFAYLEIDTHGLVFYSQEHGRIQPEAMPATDEEKAEFIPTTTDIYMYATWPLAWFLFYLKYSLRIYEQIGYDGPLMVRLGLDRIQGRQIRIPLNSTGTSFEEGRPMLDDQFAIERETLTSTARSDPIAFGKDVFKAFTFGCGWDKAYSAPEEFLDRSVDLALSYLMWNRDDLASS